MSEGREPEFAQPRLRRNPTIAPFVPKQPPPTSNAASSEKDGSNEEPGLLAKSRNFGVAVVRHVLDGTVKVDDKSYFDRLEICRKCSACDVVRMVCTNPGCGCQLYVKARWRSEECPLKKWRRQNDGELSDEDNGLVK